MKKQILVLLACVWVVAPVVATVDSRLYDFENGTPGATTTSIADSIGFTTVAGSGDNEGLLWLEVAGNLTRPLPGGSLQTVVNNSALTAPALDSLFGDAATYVNVADGSPLDSPALGSNVGLQFDGLVAFDDLNSGPGSRGVFVDADAFAANDPVVSQSNTFESFSILSQAWVRPDSASSGTGQTIYQIGNEQGAVEITSDGFWKVTNLGPWYDGPTGELTTTVPVEFDSWTHVAVRRSGVDATLYVNGQPATIDPPDDQFFNGFALSVTLGADSTGGNAFEGVVDDFRLSGFADGVFDRFQDLAYFDSVDNLVIVNQETGNISLMNTGSESVTFSEYSLTSTNGALNGANWLSIADNYDGDSGGSVDSDIWSIVTQTANELAESETPVNDGITLAPGESIDLGNIWFQSPIRDLLMNKLGTTGEIVDAKVVYVDGMGNESDPIATGDLTFEGVIDESDWGVFIQNYGGDFSGMSVAESYGKGDLDFDGDSDINDFNLFVDAFDAANGDGAFAAMLPEPASATLVALAGLFPLLLRRWIK